MSDQLSTYAAIRIADLINDIDVGRIMSKDKTGMDYIKWTDTEYVAIQLLHREFGIEHARLKMAEEWFSTRRQELLDCHEIIESCKKALAA